jgi:hypothetical protein
MIVVFRRRGCGDGDVKPIAMMIENGSRVVGPLSLTKYCSSPEGGMIPARLSRRQSGFRKAEGGDRTNAGNAGRRAGVGDRLLSH